LGDAIDPICICLDMYIQCLYNRNNSLGVAIDPICIERTERTGPNLIQFKWGSRVNRQSLILVRYRIDEGNTVHLIHNRPRDLE